VAQHVADATKEAFNVTRMALAMSHNLIGKSRSPTQSFVATCVVPFYILYPQLVTAVFKLASCRTLGGGSLFLRSDLDFQCYTSKHVAVLVGLGLPGLLFYVLGMPLGAFLLLWKNKERIHSVDSRFKYGFLYLGYKDEWSFWEVTVMLRKAAFIFIAVFMEQFGTDIQTYLAIIVLTVAFSAHVAAHPYNKDSLQSLELHSLGTSLATMQMGLFLFSDTPGFWVRVVLSILILYVNMFFLGRALRVIVKERYDAVHMIRVVRKVKKEQRARLKAELKANGPGQKSVLPKQGGRLQKLKQMASEKVALVN
jgi:hypothetical protein